MAALRGKARGRQVRRGPPRQKRKAEESGDESDEGTGTEEQPRGQGEVEPEAPTEQPLSLNFGKRLAHTDKTVRDRGFKQLKLWIQKHPNLSRLDHLKLWKGLYFGMWMSDKWPVQQELAVHMALLINDVPPEKQAQWIDAFWEIMQGGWENLDRHRINKYLLIIRIIVAEAFKVIRVGGWNLDKVRAIADTFTRGVPRGPRSGINVPSLGLLLQYTRVLWEELDPQLTQAPAASNEVLMRLLDPFLEIVEWSNVRVLVKCIHSDVFCKAPHRVLEDLSGRILGAAAKEEIPRDNRKALYDTLDVLDKLLGKPPRKPLESSVKVTRLPPIFPDKAKRKRKKKTKASSEAADKGESAAEGNNTEGAMSPLILPEAALPDAVPPLKKKKRRRTADASADDDSVLPEAAAPADAAPSEAVEDTAMAKRPRKQKKAAAGGEDAPAAPKAAAEPAPAKKPRNVAFDMSATKVLRYSKAQQVANPGSTPPAGPEETRRRSALRKGSRQK